MFEKIKKNGQVIYDQKMVCSDVGIYYTSCGNQPTKYNNYLIGVRVSKQFFFYNKP